MAPKNAGAEEGLREDRQIKSVVLLEPLVECVDVWSIPWQNERHALG